MRLSYIGHATFLVASDAGVRILLDPFQPGAFGAFRLRPFTGPVDVVVSTHDHLDHFHLDPSFGAPAVVREQSATAAGVEFLGVRMPHDEDGGSKRGFVTGFRFEVDGVSILHPGDLGRPFSDEELAAFGRVDVLLMPCGGTFTVGPAEALEAIRRLSPAVAIPMHYKIPQVSLPLLPVDEFLALVPAFERAEGQPVEFTAATLPAPTKILVLDPLG